MQAVDVDDIDEGPISMTRVFAVGLAGVAATALLVQSMYAIRDAQPVSLGFWDGLTLQEADVVGDGVLALAVFWSEVLPCNSSGPADLSGCRSLARSRSPQ